MSRPFVLTAISVFVLGMAMTACQKVTQDNFAKVQDDMTYEQVKDILGEGQQSSGAALNLPGIGASVTWYEWTNSDTGERIVIGFVNNKVKYKQYTGAEKKT